MNFKKVNIKLLIISILCILAIFDASYLTNLAYNLKASSEPSYVLNNIIQSKDINFGGGTIGQSVCDINSTLSCSGVFNNDFAWIFGIPFSLFALFVYPIVLSIALLGLFKKIKNPFKYIFFISIAGLLFNLYIIINEYNLGVYCIMCMICTGIIIINAILSLIGMKQKNKL